MFYLLRIFFIKKIFRKTFWCFQNFLTMEFYRKICNKCYWSNIYNSRHSIVKQSLIIFISFVSVLFFSFFYLPTDPANSHKSSYHIRLLNFVSGIKVTPVNIFNHISNKIIQFSSSFIDILRTNLYSREIMDLKSCLQI